MWLRGVFRSMPNIYDEAFCGNSWGLEAVNCLCKKVAGPQACNFIKKRLQHSWFQVKFDFFFFKISKVTTCSNIFQLCLLRTYMSLTNLTNLTNQTWNSHNDKVIWKCIHLPKFCSEQNLVEVYFHIFIFLFFHIFIFSFFSIKTFSALSNDQSFPCFH